MKTHWWAIKIQHPVGHGLEIVPVVNSDKANDAISFSSDTQTDSITRGEIRRRKTFTVTVHTPLPVRDILAQIGSRPPLLLNIVESEAYASFGL